MTINEMIQQLQQAAQAFGGETQIGIDTGSDYTSKVHMACVRTVHAMDERGNERRSPMFVIEISDEINSDLGRDGFSF